MGKQLKKGRPPPGGKQFFKKVTKQPGETDEVVTVMEQRRTCVHFDKCVDLDKLLKKMKACEQIKCGECKEGVLHMKKRSEGKKAMWLCLECGLYICGGVGLPTEPQSHVMRHFRLTRHRLVIQCENTRLRWCFSCKSLLPFKKEENGEKIDLLTEAVKLIKERSSDTYSSETEAEDSSSSSIFGEIKDSSAVSREGYAVRGLVNLGNTCFFNSVLQNLLSLDQLRYHLLKEDLCYEGPLVSSLKNLFTEATSVASFFNSVINPSACFGSVCSKAPQFKGYLQHDSHELLRCLLDGLSIEESSLRKKLDVSDDSEKPTLVDSVFGGEVSSTISCLECGHSSKVYEPFLDLSLPVPSKKPPPRKQQTFSQEERSKLLPTKVFKNVEDSKDSSEPVSTMTLDNNQVPEIVITQKDMEEVDSFWWEAFRTEVPHNETDLVSQGDVSDTSPLLQSEVADQTFVGNAKPDKEDALAMQCSKDTASSEISVEINEAQVWGYPDLGQSSSSANPFDDEEIPLLVADSQVLYKDDKTVAEDKGEASLAVSGHHEKTVDYDDFFSWCFDEPDISCDDKTVAEDKGEASSSDVSGHQEKTVDYDDFFSWCFDEPVVSCDDKTVKEREGEVSSSLVSSQHVQTVDYADLNEPNVSCNDKTVKERECEASSSFVRRHHKQKIDSADHHWFHDDPEEFQGPFYRPPFKAKASKAWFMDISSNSDDEVLDDSDSPVSVESCLALFTNPEILSEDNAWHCENCSKNLKLQRLREKRERFGNGWMNENGFDECRDNLFNQSFIDFINWESMYDDESVDDSEEVIVRSPASKRVLVNKAPPVLTIHLKRFSQNARGRLSKLSGHVAFNEFIDLGLFMDMDSRGTEEEQPVYMLTGLVEHSGTMRRGHYVAYIRGDHDENKDSYIWYRASDSFVRQVSFEEVLRSEAYILFYQRI